MKDLTVYINKEDELVGAVSGGLCITDSKVEEDKSVQESQEELWEDCLSLIDEKAREVDECEFGLPRFEDPKDKTIKEFVMEQFTITRNP